MFVRNALFISLFASLSLTACTDPADSESSGIGLSASPAAGVLDFVNDVDHTDFRRLDVDCALRSDTSKNVIRHRDGRDRLAGTADDDYFDDVDELDDVRMVGPWSLQRISNCAWLYGYLKAAGPTLTGSGTAVVNGTMSAGEWDDAASMPVLVQGAGREQIPATLYLMTDDRRMYMALHLEADFTDRMFRFTVLFDNNGDGLADPGEDRIAAVYSPSSRTTRFADAHVLSRYQRAGDNVASFVYDASHGGTSDGLAATGFAGGATVLELWHPLNSGDDRDVSLAAGAAVPFAWDVGVLDEAWVDTREWANLAIPAGAGQTATMPWELPASVIADLAARADGYKEPGIAAPMTLAEQTADLVDGVPASYQVRFFQWIDREGGIQLWVEFELDADYNITGESAYI